MYDYIAGFGAFIFSIGSLISFFAIFVNVKQDLVNRECGNAAISFVSGIVITGSFAAFAYIFWLV